jgi:hypothetical protein
MKTSYAIGWALIAMGFGAILLGGCEYNTAIVCSEFENTRTICTDPMPQWQAAELAQNLAGEPGVVAWVEVAR